MLIQTTYKNNELTGSNYWGSELEKIGLVFLSINEGKARLLWPNRADYKRHMRDLKTAKETAITLGNFIESFGAPESSGIEILFDDYTSHPFAIHSVSKYVDKLEELTSKIGSTIKLEVWELHKGVPRRRLSRNCLIRTGTIPDLRPV